MEHYSFEVCDEPLNIELFAAQDGHHDPQTGNWVPEDTHTLDAVISIDTQTWLSETFTINNALTQGLRHCIEKWEDTLAETEAIKRWFYRVTDPREESFHGNTYNEENILSDDILYWAGTLKWSDRQIVIVSSFQGYSISPTVLEPTSDSDWYDVGGPRTMVCTPEYVEQPERDPELPEMDMIPMTPKVEPIWYRELGSNSWRVDSWPQLPGVYNLEDYDCVDSSDLDEEEMGKWNSGEYREAGYILLDYDTDGDGKVTGKFLRCPVTGRKLVFGVY